MPDFTVIRHGTDPNGRPIYMTRFMQDWWEGLCHRLGFTPTIVQGAFMARAGGGASASAGYHDQGGCLDLRTWNLSGTQVSKLINECRRSGAGAWVRDHRHGMDPHIHLVLGSDKPLAAGAAWQWREYLAGRNGLASRGADYHWRPDPIVTRPPRVRVGPTAFFIDISHHQGGFDFERAKEDGMVGAVLKCTEGEGMQDPRYTDNLFGALTAGLGVMAYHWLHAGNRAYIKRQADNLAANIGDKRIPVVVDCELGSTKPQIRHVARFVRQCRKRGLTVRALYLPRWYWAGHMGSPTLVRPVLRGVRLWQSDYGDNPQGPPADVYPGNHSARWEGFGGRRVHFLQFGDRVRIAGQLMDCNAFRGDSEKLSSLFHLEDDMPTPEDYGKAVVEAKVNTFVGADNEKKEWSVGQHLRHNEQEIDRVKQKLDEVNAKLDVLVAALEGEGEEPAPKA